MVIIGFRSELDEEAIDQLQFFVALGVCAQRVSRRPACQSIPPK
jgi:hypothetical protein